MELPPGSTPQLRIPVIPSSLKWIVLPEALDMGRRAEEAFNAFTNSGRDPHTGEAFVEETAGEATSLCGSVVMQFWDSSHWVPQTVIYESSLVVSTTPPHLLVSRSRMTPFLSVSRVSLARFFLCSPACSALLSRCLCTCSLTGLPRFVCFLLELVCPVCPTFSALCCRRRALRGSVVLSVVASYSTFSRCASGSTCPIRTRAPKFGTSSRSRARSSKKKMLSALELEVPKMLAHSCSKFRQCSRTLELSPHRIVQKEAQYPVISNSSADFKQWCHSSHERRSWCPCFLTEG